MPPQQALSRRQQAEQAHIAKAQTARAKRKPDGAPPTPRGGLPPAPASAGPRRAVPRVPGLPRHAPADAARPASARSEATRPGSARSQASSAEGSKPGSARSGASDAARAAAAPPAAEERGARSGGAQASEPRDEVCARSEVDLLEVTALSDLSEEELTAAQRTPAEYVQATLQQDVAGEVASVEPEMPDTPALAVSAPMPQESHAAAEVAGTAQLPGEDQEEDAEDREMDGAHLQHRSPPSATAPVEEEEEEDVECLCSPRLADAARAQNVQDSAAPGFETDTDPVTLHPVPIASLQHQVGVMEDSAASAMGADSDPVTLHPVPVAGLHQVGIMEEGTGFLADECSADALTTELRSALAQVVEEAKARLAVEQQEEDVRLEAGAHFPILVSREVSPAGERVTPPVIDGEDASSLSSVPTAEVDLGLAAGILRPANAAADRTEGGEDGCRLPDGRLESLSSGDEPSITQQEVLPVPPCVSEQRQDAPDFEMPEHRPQQESEQLNEQEKSNAQELDGGLQQETELQREEEGSEDSVPEESEHLKEEGKSEESVMEEEANEEKERLQEASEQQKAEEQSEGSVPEESEHMKEEEKSEEPVTGEEAKEEKESLQEAIQQQKEDEEESDDSVPEQSEHLKEEETSEVEEEEEKLQEESKHQKEEKEESCEQETHNSLQEDGEHKREVENAEEPVTEEEETAKEKVEQEEEEEQMHGLIQRHGPEQEQCQYSPHLMVEEQEVSSELESEAEGVHLDQLVPQMEGDDFRVKEGDNDHTSLPMVIEEGGHFNPLLTEDADASSTTTISVPADAEGCPAQNLEDEGLVSETWNGAYHAEESLHEKREQDGSEKEAEEHAVQLVGKEDWAQEDQEALKQKQDNIDIDVAKLGSGDPWELQEHHPTEEEEEEEKDEELKENRSEEEDEDENGDKEENQEIGLGHMPEKEELEAHRAELEGEQQKEEQEQEQQQQEQEHEVHEQEEERQELGLCHMPEGQLEAHQAVHEDEQYERQREEQEWEEDDLRQELGLSHVPEEEELEAHRAELGGQQQEEEQPEQEQQQERQEQEEHEEQEQQEQEEQEQEERDREEREQEEREQEEREQEEREQEEREQEEREQEEREQEEREQEEREQEEREQDHEEDRPELVLCNEPSREQERGPQSACAVQAEEDIKCQESEDEFGVVAAAAAEEGEEPVARRDDAEPNRAHGADGQWGHSPAMPHIAAAPCATAEALMASAGLHPSPPELFGKVCRLRVEQHCPEHLLAESALKEETVSDKLPVFENAVPEVKRPEEEKFHSAEKGCRGVAVSKAALLTALRGFSFLALGTTFAVFSAVELAWQLGPQPDPCGFPFY